MLSAVSLRSTPSGAAAVAARTASRYGPVAATRRQLSTLLTLSTSSPTRSAIALLPTPHATQQRRAYRLLPSQTLSLIEAHIPAALGDGSTSVQVATSVDDVVKAVRAVGSFPMYLQADILDLKPDKGAFITALKIDKDKGRFAAQGTTQAVWNEDEAQALARLWLDSSVTFLSAAQPYMQKKTPAIIVRRAPRVESDEAASLRNVRFIVAADRRPHKAGNGAFFGSTLSIVSAPLALHPTSAQLFYADSAFTVGIDVSPLKHAKKTGEVTALLDGTDSGTGADKELHKVAEATAQLAWEQQATHIKLDANAKAVFMRIATQAVTAFWRGDGDRFVLDVKLSAQRGASDASAQLVSAVLQFDDDGLARQKTLKAMRDDGSLLWGAADSTGWQQTPVHATRHELHELEEEAEKAGMVYRKHPGGNVGLFGYGAGMGMGTVDGLIAEGGRPANFFDGGGGASVENSKEAMRILAKDPDVKCILVNIFGGITRSDLVSQGITEAYRDYKIKLPLVARFRGNKSQEAQETLRESGLNVELFDDYRPAARRAKEIAGARASFKMKAGSSSAGKSGARKPKPASAGRSQQKRGFATATHASRPNVQALIGYAFAGKPRQPESHEDGSGKTSSTPPPRQGFPASSPIGTWVDGMLRNGEAGEDALLVSSMKGEGDCILAVADGVGGWSENGVDPALFSQALMYHAGQYAQRFFACPQRLEEDSDSTQESPLASPLSTPPPSPQSEGKGQAVEAGTPLDVLQYAFQQTLSQKEVPAGSATACIVTFDSSKGVLRSANLGDSGFLVLRAGSKNARNGSTAETSAASADGTSADTGMHVVHYQSKPQTHGFNTPLQLSKLPPEYRFDNSIDSQPHHAATWDAPVRDGDIVLVATDGFWDNVSTAEVLQLVAFIRGKHRGSWAEQAEQQGSDTASSDGLAEERDLANVLAANLLSYARMCQSSTTKTSPFERDAARHGIHYPGGKVDDVAILVSLIVER